MDVSRFITEYPVLRKAKERFAYDLYHLEEFYKERYTDVSSASAFGNLLKHQKVIARFMAGSTPYNGLLVVHEVGTGKTCGAIAIAEANRQNVRRIYFVSPNSHLNSQQKKELGVCFPSIFGDGRGRQEKKLYAWETQSKLAKKVRSMSDFDVYNEFSNTIVIVDEAHDLIPSAKVGHTTSSNETDDTLSDIKARFSKLLKIVRNLQDGEAHQEEIDDAKQDVSRVREEIQMIEENKDVSLDRTKQYSRLFSIPINIKVILLTGTPMTNSANEFPPLLNLLNLNNNTRAPTILTSDWDNLSDPNQIDRETRISEQMRGRISFLRSSPIGNPKSFTLGMIPEDTDRSSMWYIKHIAGKPATFFSELSKFEQNGWSYPSSEERGILMEKINSRMKGTTLYICTMSDIQTKAYTPHWIICTFPKNKRPQWLPPNFAVKDQVAWLNPAELAALIIVPIERDGRIDYLTGANLTEWMDTIDTQGVAINMASLLDWFKFPTPAIGRPKQKTVTYNHTTRLRILYNYCPKYAASIERILTCHKEKKKVFVFNRLVEGGATRTFALLLATFGYTDWTSTTKELRGGKGDSYTRQVVPSFPSTAGKRFILLTGKTPVSKADALRLYNDPRNARGAFIQVIIGSEAIKQGFNIKDVQEMHLLAPPWNYSSLDQAMGRIVRQGSHTVIDQISNHQVSVKVYLFTAIPSYQPGTKFNLEEWEQETDKQEKNDIERKRNALVNCNSVDLKKYHDLELKDRAVKRMERLIKVNAIDCPLFYERNKANGMEGKRECEYEDSCEYLCTGMTREEMENEVPGFSGEGAGIDGLQLKKTNFNVLYSENEVTNLTNNMREIFSMDDKRVLLASELGLGVDSYEELQGLSDLISRHEVLVDAQGFPNYLKEENGSYFLSRTPQNAPGELMAAQRPSALIRDYTSDALDLLSNKLIQTLICERPVDKDRFVSLIKLSSPETQEYLLETAFVERQIAKRSNSTVGLSIKNLRVEIILEELGKYLYHNSDNEKVYSSLLDPECHRSILLSDIGTDVFGAPTTWCSRRISWSSPTYWHDDDKPTMDTEKERLKELFIKTIRWPGQLSDQTLKLKIEKEKQTIDAKLLRLEKDLALTSLKPTEREKLVMEQKLFRSNKAALTPFICGVGDPSKEKSTKQDVAKYFDLRWIFRGSHGIESVLSSSEESAWRTTSRESGLPTGQRLYKKHVGRKDKKRSTILGLNASDNAQRQEIIEKYGIDPLHLCVPADARKPGQGGRGPTTMPPPIQLRLRKFLDNIRSLEGRTIPYWTLAAQKKSARTRYVHSGMFSELERLGLWDKKFPIQGGQQPDGIQKIGLDLAGLSDDAATSPK